MGAKIILAGGSGFIGGALARRLAGDDAEVVVLTRDPGSCHLIGDTAGRVRAVEWDGRTAGAWAAELDGATALVNLAGKSIDCVHDAENRPAILGSRVDAVRALAEAAKRATKAPPVWVQASAVGYYGPRGDEHCTEETRSGDGFLAEVCREWEAAFAADCPAGVRGVVVRIAMVLGPGGGAWPRLAGLARKFAAGAAGSGEQGMSWIHLDDLTRIILRAIDDGSWSGTYNACAPAPVSNADFMAALREALHRPWCPPAPALAVRLMAKHVLQVEPSLVLEGQFVVPARLEAAGFEFRHPEIAAALKALAREE